MRRLDGTGIPVDLMVDQKSQHDIGVRLFLAVARDERDEILDPTHRQEYAASEVRNIMTRRPAIANALPLLVLTLIAAGMYLLWNMFRPVQGTGVPKVTREGPFNP